MAIVEDRGGLEYARRRATDFAEAAEEALSDVSGGEAHQSLLACVGYATQRSR